jgi:hypothetical protein
MLPSAKGDMEKNNGGITHETTIAMDSQYIKDLNGQLIYVTDLKAAIRQAECFADLRHRDSRYAALDSKLRDYWTDVLTQLKTLQTKNTRHGLHRQE